MPKGNHFFEVEYRYQKWMTGDFKPGEYTEEEIAQHRRLLVAGALDKFRGMVEHNYQQEQLRHPQSS